MLSKLSVIHLVVLSKYQLLCVHNINHVSLLIVSEHFKFKTHKIYFLRVLSQIL